MFFWWGIDFDPFVAYHSPSFSVTRIIYLSAAEALWKKTRSAVRFSRELGHRRTRHGMPVDCDMVLFRESSSPEAMLESSYR